MNHNQIIPTSFFQNAAIELAPKLLGKELVRQYPQGEITSLIIQWENTDSRQRTLVSRYRR